VSVPGAPGPAARGGWAGALGHLYDRAVVVLASALMLVVVAIMGTQVFFRYVLNDSLIWAEEVSGYLLVVMTFLFLGAAFERGEMVAIRLFVDVLPPRLALALRLPPLVAMIAFLLILSVYAARFAALGAGYNIPAASFIGSALLGRSADVQLSMYWLYLAIPLGCLILAAHLTVALWRTAWELAGRGAPARGRAPVGGD
jgi:TRAP-type C4-dicarboxylate transport system permease small subunit